MPYIDAGFASEERRRGITIDVYCRSGLCVGGLVGVREENASRAFSINSRLHD